MILEGTIHTHARFRQRGFRVKGQTMIGRLVDGEFDRLDAIVVNGGFVHPTTMAKTLDATVEGTTRQLHDLKNSGLVSSHVLDYVSAANGDKNLQIPVHGYALTRMGALLFREALWMMDHGRVAA